MRQAAVGLVSGAAFFLLLQLGLALVIETGVTELRDPSYECRLHRLKQQLGTGPRRPALVVVLGSSRTLMGLRGVEAGRHLSHRLGRPVVVMNFAVAGGGPLTALLTWKRLRQDGVRPDLLLVEVLPPALSAASPPDELGAVRLPTERLRWQDLALVERYCMRPGLRRDWRHSWPLAWYTHRLAVLGSVASVLVPPAHRLTGGQDLDASGSIRDLDGSWPYWDTKKATEVAFREYAPLLARHQPGGPACAALHELLFSARHDGIATALVLMPEGPHFRSWYPPPVRDTIDRWLAGVVQQHEVPLLDTRAWLPESAFWDSHHLRPDAARRFTQRLCGELLPFLRERGWRELCYSGFFRYITSVRSTYFLPRTTVCPSCSWR